MVSSSDWIAGAAAGGMAAGANGANGANGAAEGMPPAWIAAVPQPGRFVAGFGFAGSGAAKPGAGPKADDHTAALQTDDNLQTALDAPSDAVLEAHSRGIVEGRRAAEAEIASHDDRMRAMRLSFQALDKAATDALAEELGETVIALCSEAIEGFAPDAKALHVRCTRAATRLGGAVQDCTLHLHPDDIELLGSEALPGWTIRADQQAERGGLRFEGPHGAVTDGPSDWRRAITDALRG